ncbi:MAG: protoporphyrinogen oxidase [Actinomycetota bacterium]|nr:protoporphyrinogen oxidase [Actinomycetota bacterium]
MTVAIIGGGLAGVATAAYLVEGGVSPSEIAIFERDARLGGKVETAFFGDRPVDLGPDAFLTRTQDAIGFAEMVGIGDRLIRPSVFSASIYAKGRLHKVPSGIMLGVPVNFKEFFSSASMISLAGKLRAAADFVLPKSQLGEDYTVSELVGKRFGREVEEMLVEPMLGGINAGSTKDLGIEAVAPMIKNAYKKSPGRSLTKNLVSASPKSSTATPAQVPFGSFSNGLSELIDATIKYVDGISIYEGVTVAEVTEDPNGVRVQTTDGTTYNFDKVVLASPAFSAHQILQNISSEARRGLSSIDFASVGVVLLRYRKDSIRAQMNGSGVLVPMSNNFLMTATTYASRKWGHISSDEYEIFKVSVGRFRDTRFLQMNDEQIVEKVSREIEEILKIDSSPDLTLLKRWDKALPQFRPYHREMVASIRGAVEANQRVALAGASYDGVGIPSCIASARSAAQRLLDWTK